MRENKGVFFTLAIVLILIPLVLLISFQSSNTRTDVVDTTEKIRCDELHFFVEDIKKDLGRAGAIFGRRAAIYAIDYVISTRGNPLDGYSFNCSQDCGLGCDRFTYPMNGSGAAIAELASCGTINNTNVTYMINHTIKEWRRKIVEESRDKNFAVNLTINDIEVVQLDAWNFSIIVRTDVEAVDLAGICYYSESNAEIVSNTSIVGLEDPLYTLGSEGKIIKYIDDCTADINITTVAGCSKSDRGVGNGSGSVIFYSDLPASAGTYCSADMQEYVNDKIIVFDIAFGSCNQIDPSCFNQSAPYHFVGFIDYAPNDPNSFVKKCLETADINSTIAWISDTGTMDNESHYGQERLPGCDMANITHGSCIYMKNDVSVVPEIHQIIMGLDPSRLNYTCYAVSNSTRPIYSGGCSPVYPDGPSFFDRLDGRYNLSDKYMNQSRDYIGDPELDIGIETIVNIYELMSRGIDPYPDASKIDYLHWKNISGEGICMVCSYGQYSFKMDCQHKEKYNLSIC